MSREAGTVKREAWGVNREAQKKEQKKRQTERKGNSENLFYHEGVEGGNTTAKQNFTMKDMKNLKGEPLGVNREA